MKVTNLTLQGPIRKTRKLLLFALWFGACNAGLAEVYSLKDLGLLTDLPGRTDSMPNGINSNGEVAGANVTSGAYRAFLYGYTWTNLGTLGGDGSLAAALNDLSQVVGYSLTTGGVTNAFLWTPGGTDGVPTNPQMKNLGTLGGDRSEAYAINNLGQITGFAQTPSSEEHAFRYSGGVMTDIGSLLGPDLLYSFGYGINDVGHVAGTAYDINYYTPHAFFYNGSTAVEIGNVNGEGSFGLAINNGDHIVGHLITNGWFRHAFHYFGGVTTDLGTLGGNYSYALGINNSNVIVGGSFIDAADTVYHAFVTVNNTLVDLNTQIDETGAGWTLVEARAINDAGQIVGVGTYGGQARAFLLNPAPRITSVDARGYDFLVSFTTVNNANYTLVGRDDVASGAWSDVVTGISGNGGIVTATNTGALTLPKRFYRAKLSSP